MDKLLEKDIQKAILEYLSFRRIFAWRNNSGRMPYSSNGKDYMIQMGPKGSADIIGILNDGRFLAIEVKRPGGVLTDEQIKFLDVINKKGGLAFTAYSLDDVTKQI